MAEIASSKPPMVRDFASHPEIRVMQREREQPGQDTAALRFNHAKHLQAEGVLGPDRQRERLDCVACHEPESDRKHMKPIAFDRHCSRCHANALVFDAPRFPDQPAPHGVAMDLVRGAIRDRYTRFIHEHPRELEDIPREATVRIPGKFRSAPLSRVAWEWVNRHTDEAERKFFEAAANCKFCHQVTTKAENGREMWVIVPTRIPRTWLRNSVFDHDGHRNLACVSCHQRADGSPVSSSESTSDVLLPTLESCKTCHGPQKQGITNARGDCVACHSYHNKHNQFGKERFDGPLPLEPSTWPAVTKQKRSADDQ